MPKYLIQSSYTTEGIHGLVGDSAPGRRADVGYMGLSFPMASWCAELAWWYPGMWCGDFWCGWPWAGHSWVHQL